jgi:23S rRNA pseudouridine1911/1915/1917 synthase
MEVRSYPDYEVLFEDSHFLVVNKMCFLPVQPGKVSDDSLLSRLMADLRWKESSLQVTQRIDQPVSGVVVFAKDQEGLSSFNKLLHDRRVQKIYWAVVTSNPGPDGHLVHHILTDKKINRSRAFLAPRAGTKKAELEYRTLISFERYWGIEVRLITGRQHQIRAQLSAINAPIKGDLKYGAPRSNPGGGISLHARKLSFIHPYTGEEIICTASPPLGKDGSPDPLWSGFPE